MRVPGTFSYWLVIPVLSWVCSGCCLANYKCRGDEYDERYQLLSVSGSNLLFGPGRVYDPALIQCYSMNGTDTVFHRIGAGPNPQPGQDSLLFVSYDYRKFSTVFLRLSAIDTDTLQLGYETIEADRCCPDFETVVTSTYNNTLPGKGMYGEIILKK